MKNMYKPRSIIPSITQAILSSHRSKNIMFAKFRKTTKIRKFGIVAIDIGFKIAAIPRINVMLTTQLPIILPITRE